MKSPARDGESAPMIGRVVPSAVTTAGAPAPSPVAPAAPVPAALSMFVASAAMGAL